MLKILLAISIVSVLSSDAEQKTKICLTLIKSYFSEAAEEMSAFIKSTTLDSELFAKKIFADFFFNCYGSIGDMDLDAVLEEDYELQASHKELLGFDKEKYKTEEDIMLTEAQAELLDQIMAGKEKSNREKYFKDRTLPPQQQDLGFFSSFGALYAFTILLLFGGFFYCGYYILNKPPRNPKSPKKEKKKNR